MLAGLVIFSTCLSSITLSVCPVFGALNGESQSRKKHLTRKGSKEKNQKPKPKVKTVFLDDDDCLLYIVTPISYRHYFDRFLITF